MKSKVMGFFSKMRITTGVNSLLSNKRFRFVSMVAVITFIACVLVTPAI